MGLANQLLVSRHLKSPSLFHSLFFIVFSLSFLFSPPQIPLFLPCLFLFFVAFCLPYSPKPINSFFSLICILFFFFLLPVPLFLSPFCFPHSSPLVLYTPLFFFSFSSFTPFLFLFYLCFLSSSFPNTPLFSSPEIHLF